MVKDISQIDRESFRLLVDSVKDYAIFMIDLAGRVSTWNKGAEQIKGYKAREIIGSHIAFSILRKLSSLMNRKKIYKKPET